MSTLRHLVDLYLSINAGGPGSGRHSENKKNWDSITKSRSNKSFEYGQYKQQKEFKKGVRTFKSPSGHLVVADNNKNSIGYGRSTGYWMTQTFADRTSMNNYLNSQYGIK